MVVGAGLGMETGCVSAGPPPGSAASRSAPGSSTGRSRGRPEFRGMSSPVRCPRPAACLCPYEISIGAARQAASDSG
eukprot:11700840-Heterocapsa_arctica.AAC.1